MQYKKMGRTGLKVSPLGVGTMFYGSQVAEAEAVKIIDLKNDFNRISDEYNIDIRFDAVINK